MSENDPKTTETERQEKTTTTIPSQPQPPVNPGTGGEVTTERTETQRQTGNDDRNNDGSP